MSERVWELQHRYLTDAKFHARVFVAHQAALGAPAVEAEDMQAWLRCAVAVEALEAYDETWEALKSNPDLNKPMFPLPDMDYDLREGDSVG